MKQEIYEAAAIVNKALKQGRVFLNSRDEKDNTMIIGWGGILNFWTKPVFLAPVRLSRYTHDPIAKTGYFTVSVPKEGELSKAAAFCGARSGRDHDKFKECGLTAVAGRSVPVSVIGECSLHIECRVLQSQELDLGKLNEEDRSRFYADGDTHMLFMGEILACYTTE
jgi:flavin reductase (DIM6/NTAB) family NADH-FMN oxidoreductase RutF